jgi:DNA polymerase III epsilon subunit family exonuclease
MLSLFSGDTPDPGALFSGDTQDPGPVFSGDTPDPGPATPLSEVTFAVIDLETTGMAPGQSRIIEVGAARFRGGECLGTFQTLVNPGCGVPPFITVLTGITEAVLVPAPPIDEVLPTLLEFLGDAVLVGHNLGFDTAFLDAALFATGRRPLHQPRVDTLALARRLMGDEVPNRRLATLARFFHTDTQPTHRALDDVLATVGVLHGLLERAGTLGILALDDLLAFPSTPLALAKLPLACPAAPACTCSPTPAGGSSTGADRRVLVGAGRGRRPPPPGALRRPAGRPVAGGPPCRLDQAVDDGGHVGVLGRHAAFGVGRERYHHPVVVDLQVGMVVGRLGRADHALHEPDRFGEPLELELLGDLALAPAPAGKLVEGAVDLGIGKSRHDGILPLPAALHSRP